MLRGRRRRNGNALWRMVVGEDAEGEGGIMGVDLVVDGEGVGRDSKGVGVIIDLLHRFQQTKRIEMEEVETHNHKRNCSGKHERISDGATDVVSSNEAGLQCITEANFCSISADLI